MERLNATVKFREPFRPFAPVVLQANVGDYFTIPRPAPFMSIASGVTARTWAQVPAVVHVNGTARVQTVTPASNPFVAEVLGEFAAITGHPLLINTSLNVKGKPICGTPDGGRSHRRVLVDGLRSRGHELVFLQANRDLAEAGHDLTATYRCDDGLPDIDALFLEWRWPVRGHNTTACGSPGHTCDLHRQQQLLDHYVRAGIPTLLWDKDRQLKVDSLLRDLTSVTVCEPALYPSPGAVSLLFLVADAAIVAAGRPSWSTDGENCR